MIQIRDSVDLPANIKISGGFEEVFDCGMFIVTAKDFFCFFEPAANQAGSESPLLMWNSLIWLVDIIDRDDS